MLSIDIISDNKEETLIGLKKRGFKNLTIIDEVIDLNLSRKKIQQELDQILFGHFSSMNRLQVLEQPNPHK